eukprot:461885-Lingulodinium_polyedra.AAC.1
MQAAWRNRIRLTLRPEQFRPASPTLAVVAAISRAGWVWPAWDHFCTVAGHLVALREVCPADVRAMLTADLEAA